MASKNPEDTIAGCIGIILILASFWMSLTALILSIAD